MNDMHAVWAHPQLEARGKWTEIDTQNGKLKAMIPPGTPNTVQPMMGPIPNVGEHNAKILKELGITTKQEESKGYVA